MRLQQAQSVDKIKDQYAFVKDAKESEKKAQAAALLAQKRLNQAKQELEKQLCKLDEVLAYQKEIEPQIKAREDSYLAPDKKNPY